MPIEEVEELSLERGARSIGVEISQERVFRFVQHKRGFEPRTETLRQRPLACADRAFNGDVPELQDESDDIIAP